ncbi:MAG: 3-oxoacyl-[acyl-carrier-protein] reductase [Firmicutes bacterium]|nr:3-oxoacyl-[acyl-carrier-protein] reductase [Bacillota bacterium]
MELLGKTALVTGAGGGIGKATALLLAESGADVAVCDLNKEAVEATEKEILALGRKARAYTVDVSNAEQVQDMIKDVVADFSKIDILINNAGITRDNLLMRMKDEDWDLVLSVNLKSVFLLSKAVSRHMIKARSGKIVNVASVIGVIGNTGQANYAASKAGVIGLTKSLAKEFASRNITVNAVAPGFIKTAMTDKLSEEVKNKMLEDIPLGFLGEASDVAKVIRFLVSEDARYITGQVMHIDGGMVM